MFIFFKIFQEGILLAIQELWANKLRTFLSLLGIAIGIFCVISVLAVIDSFQNGLKKSFSKIGDNAIHISKESWDIQQITTDWWKYMKRPYPSYSEFEALQDQVTSADAINIRAILPDQKLQFKGEYIENLAIVASSFDFARMFDVEIEYGRYFSQEDMERGKNTIILGYTVAEVLFPNVDYAVGKEVKFNGRKLTVIGVIKKEGESILSDGFDEAAILPYNYFRKYYNINNPRLMQIISLRAKESASLEELKSETTLAMRAKRHLKPREENNFELNHLSLLTGMIDNVFLVVTLAGFLIGFFAILVGAFGIANIMFVSVKERTRIIGIKKSLGAKRIYILLEFLVESIILTVVGGLLGLGLVLLLLFVGNNFIDAFELFLSRSNIFWGLLISIVTGVIAGLIPAIIAAFLNPVEAIRA